MMELPTDNSNGADDKLLLLGTQKTNQVNLFLADIRSCSAEEQKYSLCLDKRNQLLEAHSLLQIEFFYYETAFFESTIYTTSKEEDPEWQKFRTTAAEGSKNRLRIYKELKKAAEHWGEDLIQHYSIGERGLNFAIQLAATARQHRAWETDALPRLQQLVCRRIQMSVYGRHTFEHPIERVDLVNAKSWKDSSPFVKQNDPEKVLLPFTRLSVEQLPEGYSLDKFGLIVPTSTAGQGSNNSSATSIEGLDTDATSYSSANTSESTDVRDTRASSFSAHDESKAVARSDARNHASSPLEATQTTRTTASDAIVETDHDRASATTDISDGPLEGSNCTTPSDHVVRRSLRHSGNIGPHYPQTATASSRWRSTKGSRTNNPFHGSARKKDQTVFPSVGTEQLKALARKLSTTKMRNPKASISMPTVSLKRPRATSLPPDTYQRQTPKRRHATCSMVTQNVKSAPGYDHSARPRYNWPSDTAYLAETIFEKHQEAKKEWSSRGCRTARCLLPILENCKHPNIDENCGAIELYLLDGYQAKTLLDDTTLDVPVITEQQQHLTWRTPDAPILEFFEWIEDRDRTVAVQIPSLGAGECSYEPRTIQQVYERFLSQEESDDPWNILDCSCPVPSTLPDFLIGKNCQLLAQLRNKALNGESAERVLVSREHWAEWREIENWALLSQGGHCTAPHMDSHGLATWITVQAGLIGFAWMSRPTDEQCEKWMEDIEYYDNTQQWRYWILKPGQTIFFPSGTIHCVFRTRRSHTFALGGHILQWSGIEKWMDVVSKQAKAPDSTNEDMEDSWKWFSVIKGLVETRLRRSGAMT